MKTTLLFIFIYLSLELFTSQSKSALYAQTFFVNERFYTSLYSGDVIINTLRNGSAEIGHSLWLNRKNGNVKAKYFAHTENGKSVSERFNQWKTGRKIILYCSGAYTTSGDLPEGLTIDNGNLVNRNINGTTDALVVVEAVGGIRIADMDRNDCISLQSINRSVNPRFSSSERQIFINWAARQKATVFQTNLLYYDDTRKFGDVSDKAERRILVVGIKSDNSVVHILFNIEPSVSLTEISEALFNYLRYDKEINVVGMINLDPGARDIFQAYNSNGLPYSDINGTVSLSKASNLLVYYYQ